MFEIATLLLLLTCLAVQLLAQRKDRYFLYVGSAVALIIFSVLTYIVHLWMPFAGGGDDEAYFLLASIPVTSLKDAFDFTRYAGIMEQPGYPWLLSLLVTIGTHNLFALKLFNVFAFVIVGLIWYRLALEIEGNEFARKVFVAIMLVTPLWAYAFFLLKDMTIVLLQSMFLLGVVRFWNRISLVSLCLIILPTLALIMFRSPLVAQNGVVLLGAVLIKVIAGGGRRSVVAAMLTFVMFGAIFLVVSNQDLLFTFGIYSENRVVTPEALLEMSQYHQERSKARFEIFPLLYMFIEVAGLNPNTWAKFDMQWLRGLLAIPWLVFVLPFFFLGLSWLFRLEVRNSIQRKSFVLDRKVFFSPWSVVVLFIATYFVISFAVGDSTRWRAPDMPAFMVIAIAGWTYVRRHYRWHIFTYWVTSTGFLFMARYLIAEI